MIGYQLYSSRNYPPLGETLRMLAAAGYEGAEGYGGVYGDAAQLAELAAGLEATGLEMATGHFGLSQLEDEIGFVLDAVGVLGIERVYCPYVMPADRPTTSAGWRDFGARIEAAGAPLRAAGIGFGWHNHDFEFLPCADGVLPIDAIFQGGPELEWEMDVAWVVRGGGDPLAWIAKEQGRITTAHVKDIAKAGQGKDEDGWADLGDGTVNWAAILPALRAAGVRHFVLEHDNPSDHARFAQRSLAAFKGL